jgi:hypothetical protein
MHLGSGEFQAGVAQFVGDQLLQILGGSFLHPRWDLFGEKLKKQLSH